ncbi:NEL-type E3 ubiquitin ligase domain-containing protein [Bordetella bronchialis]|uniref:NEL-type E3 ubiquitin ligase domain-containing protein n=1 Tax=Bordetella bronchialis TaxID=463025 RepID=UPI003CFC41A3
MATQVGRTGLARRPMADEATNTDMAGDAGAAAVEAGGAIASALARVGGSAGGTKPPASDLQLADAWKLLPLWLTHGPRLPGPGDIAEPDAIARDGRRRMAYRTGVLAARELGLDTRRHGTDELLALGQETIADHVMAGSASQVLVALARLEGRIDDAAWASRDPDRIAGQVDAFLRTEFKDEIDLYEALDGLVAEPPPSGRRELADALLRAQDIDPDALLDTGYRAAIGDVSASSPPLVLDRKAGEVYFQADKLDAPILRRMKTRAGGTPDDAHIARVLAALPASLDAEFGRRFDGHRERMSTLLVQWLAVRLGMHARQAAIDLPATTVTVSRASLRRLARAATSLIGRGTVYRDVGDKLPSRGFLVSMAGKHRCFIAGDTGALHVVPPQTSLAAWLERERRLVFGDAAADARPGGADGQGDFVVDVENVASGPWDGMREWLSRAFGAEIERGREGLRGHTYAEGAVDTLLDLIPFRAMVVALRKGDVPSAIVMGGLDVLSLVPLVGAGVRLGGAAARAAAPWLGMGLRLGGRLAARTAGGLRQLGAGIPLLRGQVRAALATSAVHGWGRLRPLDLARVAQALRASAPRLAGILDGIAARARGTFVADGVWRLERGIGAATGSGMSGMNRMKGAGAMGRGASAAADAADAIGPAPRVMARNPQGGRLALLAYGEGGAAYTQVDNAGRRVGALLVADSGGWLHRTLPLATLERYRVATPAVLRALDGRRPGADGTVALDGRHYARLGPDYVEVRRDLAASTGARRIWRAAAPPDVVPDMVAYRLVYDPLQGLWRHTPAPGLAGGYRPAGGRAVPVASLPDVRITPDAARLARFRDALTANMRGATPVQAQAVRALVDLIASNPRGKAILNAMTAHYELLGQVPEIVLRESGHAAHPRPSLVHPVSGTAWNLDLDMLGRGTTGDAVQEFAAVYNNMTGVLQERDPFEALAIQPGPPLDPRLEQAWAAWISQGSVGVSRAAATQRRRAPGIIARQAAVSHLRTQLREMRCYGGLDRASLQSLLRHPGSRTAMKIDLSGRALDSVPPLPRDTRVLLVSNNPIQDWSHLPDGLTVLHAERTRMRRLPANLPASLVYLNVSNNMLRGTAMVLPPRLERLEMARNGLTRLPALPATLKELIVSENFLAALSPGLPGGLEMLNVNGNVLTGLPEHLPGALKVLLARGNRLAGLPHALSEGLEEADLSFNSLETLPALPGSLRILDARSNRLGRLPEDLPAALQVLVVSNNRLSRLPDNLPGQLVFLGLQDNAITELPPFIAALTRCWIFLDGNPLRAGAIPAIPAGVPGPRFSYGAFPHGAPSGELTLDQAVRPWLTRAFQDAQARWDAIALVPAMRGRAAEFIRFLARLRNTVSARDPGFRAQVQAWLADLSRPERRPLLEETLALCAGATETCDDRITLAWNDLQALHRNDDIRLGLYDDRVAEVVDIARQMFRIHVLTEIARRKERVLLALARTHGGRSVDSLEVYLSHMVHLRDALQLTFVAPRMQFHDALAVDEEHLAEAREIVRSREREEFDKFLVLDYAPWQTLLKRKNPQAYAQVQAAADEAVRDRFDEELGKELDRLQLPADPAVLDDARKDLGPGIVRALRYAAMEPLTRALLQAATPVPVTSD